MMCGLANITMLYLPIILAIVYLLSIIYVVQGLLTRCPTSTRWQKLVLWFCDRSPGNSHNGRMKPPKDLASQMAEKTDDQLLAMFKQPEDWLPEALELANVELRQRGIHAPK